MDEKEKMRKKRRWQEGRRERELSTGVDTV